jgi:signal transduction histidine kinase
MPLPSLPGEALEAAWGLALLAAAACGALAWAARRREREVRRAVEGKLRAVGAAPRGRDGDTLAALLDGLDALARRLAERERALGQQADAQVRIEKLATLGSLSAGVAHEINNPLGYMRSNCQLFLEDCAALAGDAAAPPLLRDWAASAHDFASTNLQGVDRIARIVQALRMLAKPQAERTRLDVAAVLEATIALTGSRVGQQARLVTDIPPGLVVWGSPDGLGQVVLNLLVNAAEAVRPGSGWIRVAARHEDGKVRVEVEDNGPGIPREAREHVFAPFFTTKPGGTGLGLSISQRIVEDHGGRIWFEGRAGGGTRFVLELPAAPPEPCELPAAPGSAWPRALAPVRPA